MKISIRVALVGVLGLVVFAGACQGPSASVTPAAGESPLQINDILPAYRFWMSAWPGTPVTLRALVGGMGVGPSGSPDFLMVTLTAPRLNRVEQPPRHWALALDTGAAMQGRSWTLALQAARGILARLRPQDRVALTTFGAETTLHTGWESPAEIEAVLSKLEPAFVTGEDSLARGLRHLAEGLVLTREEQKVETAGFYISNLAGATAALPRELKTLGQAGTTIHVLCVAGGDDRWLEALAKAESGRAIFLAQESDFLWHLVERFYEHFDTVARDLQVSLWFDGDECLNPEATLAPLTIAGNSIGGPGQVYGLPTVSRLGPGETRLWVFRLAKWEEGVRPKIRVRVRGAIQDGASFSLAASPERDYIACLGRQFHAAPNFALFKALFLLRHLERMREATAMGLVCGRAPFARVMERLEKHAGLMSSIDDQVSDADIGREKRALQAMLTLTEADVVRLRRLYPEGPPASALPETMQSRGFAYRLLCALFFP